jgi:RNA polymerase sigma-70 factor (ECF subfamily)
MASEVALGSVKALSATAPAAAAEGGLLELCRQGDPQAFARLVALHEGMVFGLAARLLGDVEEAKDVSQDVFLQVYRALGRFQGRSSLKTWIYRIVVNQCRNRRRFWRRRRSDAACPLDTLSAADEARVAAQRDVGTSPFDGVARRERARVVHEALLQLSFDHRAILLLREVDDLSCEEIAMTLGIAEGTVKSRLARAREAFRRVLAPTTGERQP